MDSSPVPNPDPYPKGKNTVKSKARANTIRYINYTILNISNSKDIETS
jgi:hypothetical protein